MTTRTVRLIDHPPHRPPNLGRLVQNGAIALGHRIQQWIAPHHEPTIIKGCDRHGHSYWEIYDPNTQRTMYCLSEAEVRRWLDSIV